MNTDSARLCFVADAIGALQKPYPGCTLTVQLLTAHICPLGWTAVPPHLPLPAADDRLTQAGHLALIWDYLCALELPVGSGWSQSWGEIISLLFSLPSSYSASLTPRLWRELPISEDRLRLCFWRTQPKTSVWYISYHLILSTTLWLSIIIYLQTWLWRLREVRSQPRVTWLDRYKSRESNPAIVLKRMLLAIMAACHLSKWLISDILNIKCFLPFSSLGVRNVKQCWPEGQGLVVCGDNGQRDNG